MKVNKENYGESVTITGEFGANANIYSYRLVKLINNYGIDETDEIIDDISKMESIY